MADKAKILEGLQQVQTLIYDSNEAVAAMILPFREQRLTLAGVYDKLAQAEGILEKILDLEFWN